MIIGIDKHTLPLLPGNFYHIFNRGNNREKIFYIESNYRYFLKKYDEYMSGCVDTYAYCLLPNHFHFLIRIKDDINNEKKVSEQFRKLFITYSQAINKQEKRTGSLFTKRFKRKLVKDTGSLPHLVFYIHHNPVHHKIGISLENYRWSSYSKILEPKKSILLKNEVLEWFDGVEGYVEYHRNSREIKNE